MCFESSLTQNHILEWDFRVCFLNVLHSRPSKTKRTARKKQNKKVHPTPHASWPAAAHHMGGAAADRSKGRGLPVGAGVGMSVGE